MDERVNTRDITEKLLTFLENSPPTYHAGDIMPARLRAEGF